MLFVLDKMHNTVEKVTKIWYRESFGEVICQEIKKTQFYKKMKLKKTVISQKNTKMQSILVKTRLKTQKLNTYTCQSRFKKMQRVNPSMVICHKISVLFLLRIGH